MPTPPVTGISIRRVLQAVAAQHVQTLSWMVSMVGGKLAIKCCASELRQMITASAMNAAILWSFPQASKMAPFTSDNRSC